MVAGASFEESVLWQKAAGHCEMPWTVKCIAILQYVALCTKVFGCREKNTLHKPWTGSWVLDVWDTGILS